VAGLFLFAIRQTVPLILLLGLFISIGAWHHSISGALRRLALVLPLTAAHFGLLAWEGALEAQDYLAVSLALVTMPIVTLGANGRWRLRAEALRLQQALAERELELVKASKESERLASLNKIYQTINSPLEIEKIFAAFATEVKGLIDYDRLVIEIFEQAGTQLEVVAMTANSDGISTKRVRMPFLHSASGWVAVNQQPLVRSDLNDEGGFPLDRESIDAGLRSEIIVPLTATGGIVGIIGLSSREKNKYLARDVDMVEQIGRQVATSVGSTRLHQRSREMAMVEERNRLAREIHDSIAQGLIALILQLEAVRTLLPKNAIEAMAELRRAEDLARLSLEEARRSVWDLRPSPLESLSLSQAIAHELNGVTRQAGFSAYFAVRGEEKPLTAEQEAVLFRIAQEAIRNSRKHGVPRRAEGTLEFTESEVVLVIQDDGVAFDVGHALAEAPEQDASHVLTSMQERMAMLGGQLQIERSPDGGTSVRARIPYRGPMGGNIYQGEMPPLPTTGLSATPERLVPREDLRDELTPREREVLRLIATGARNKEIGQRLSISEKTVKFHIANIFQKLGVESRTEAMSRALERGLWEP